MLLVPELSKVFILVPRTGTGSFYREMKRVYPRSILLYRHMEADGCPRCYDRWERIGFVRHPLARLYSLWSFMQDFSGGAQVQGGAASLDAARVRRQSARSFEDWLINNREPWTIPFDTNGEGAWWPILSRMNAAPENTLSQFQYLRPDLGTTIWKFEDLRSHMTKLGLDVDNISNNTRSKEQLSDGRRHARTFSDAAIDHISRFQKWDLEQDCAFV